MQVVEDAYNIWLIMDQVPEGCYFSTFLVRIASQGPECNQKTQLSKLRYYTRAWVQEKHPSGGEGKCWVGAKLPLELLRVNEGLTYTPHPLAPELEQVGSRQVCAGPMLQSCLPASEPGTEGRWRWLRQPVSVGWCSGARSREQLRDCLVIYSL